MTVIIKEPISVNNKVSASEIENGKAYRRTDTGTIYIGNTVDDVVAFSLNGEYVVRKTSSSSFEPITIEVNVVKEKS